MLCIDHEVALANRQRSKGPCAGRALTIPLQPRNKNNR